MQLKKVKLVSATVGAAAVLAMGGVTMAFSTVSVAQPEPPPPDPVTTTTTTTTVFSPTVTAEPPEGYAPG